MSIIAQDFPINELILELLKDKTEDGIIRLNLQGNRLFKMIGRRLNDPDMISIINYLKKFPEITSLELPNNLISDCGIATLMIFIKKTKNIKYINLNNNDFGYKGLESIADLGADCPFHTLKLAYNKFGALGGAALSRLFYEENALEVVDLNDTNQDAKGLAYLFTGLMPSRGGKNKIRNINLNKPIPQYFHAMPSAHIAEFLGQVFNDNTNLQEIHLRFYRFDCHDIEIMIQGSFSNNTLTCLDLNNNNIADDGVEYLCRYLKTKPVLSSLMIGANNIKDAGARRLGFDLPFSNICFLDVTNNKITDEGVKDIFYAFRKERASKGLCIWGNDMTHNSLLYLEKMLNEGLLHQNNLDVKLYTADNRLHAARNHFTYEMFVKAPVVLEKAEEKGFLDCIGTEI